ncbi:3-phosphoshikimate 1-carboxyvinyltransferase [Aureivirga sp. CE67]|uniref:3-phosphoshikimate 1-carboxyvinyltransferase n=1 Tax=Aureivirga sp. CE67 TaxID=1788983 RepID=UPI0018C95BF5|nr:3-phosphoshikimate 1-carboxyvinyltransferase [Aureivirga sp. CE67]
MAVFLPKYNGEIDGEITISGSKSESNRLLILQQLFPEIKIENLSNSDDTKLLQKALKSEEVINIGHAGTAMRFLTAFFASRENSVKVLTGSKRMQERPIGILVDALRSLGVEISYEKEEGYPPIRIKGRKIEQKEVSIQGNVSSQYISALLLIAPSLENGLKINFTSKLTSIPYIKMTTSLLESLGVSLEWKEDSIQVFPLKENQIEDFAVESDWSSASYYFSLIALSAKGKVSLQTYKPESLQGDSVLVDIYEKLGVKSCFEKNTLHLEKVENFELPEILELDLSNAPDIAQTIAVTCFGLGIATKMTGLHTLKIKETDRLVALKTELEKFGAEVMITDESLELKNSKTMLSDVSVVTYNDHRMAMAFAPLCLKNSLFVENQEVVTKSYTDFWKDFSKLTK